MRILLCVALAVACTAAGAGDSSPVLARAVAAEAPSFEQPVTFTFHQTYAVNVGSFYRSSQDATFVLASYEGATVAARAIALTTDGRPGDRSAREKAESQLSSAPVFHQPFDRRYLDEYSYSVSGSIVEFHARVRDAAHGDGRFEVDPSGHVVRLQYAPCVVASPASAGTVLVERAELIRGYWGLSRLHAEYSGRRLVVAGRLVLDGTVSDVRLHTTVDEATSDARSR